MLTYERAANEKGYDKVAGCDEAGRGCLAGPVVAAAVVIPQEKVMLLDGVTDSKQLSEKKRFTFFEIITEHLDIGLGIIEAPEIDEINIYEASRKAMLEALKSVEHNYVLTDAMPLPSYSAPVEAIIKGDQLSLSIACSSIVAKCVRDSIMYEYDAIYPSYAFANHKGYGTKKHKEALEQFGVIKNLHRMSYKPVQEVFVKQGKLF